MTGKPTRSKTSSSKLNQELLQREAELAVINSIQIALGAELDMQGIYDAVGDKILDVFDVQGVQLITFDLERNIMVRHYIVEKGQRLYVDPAPIHILWSIFVRRGKTWMVDDLQKLLMEMDPQFTPPAGDIPKSALFVPLIKKGEINGVINLSNMDRKSAFSKSDARLLETIANSMSLALENARLFDETQRLLKETKQRNAELAVINSVQEGLASKLDIQAIYELIGEKVREIFNVQVADIVTYDPITNLISMPYSYEKGDRSVIAPQEPYGFRLEVIKTRTPLLINQNFAEIASQNSNPLLTGEWPKSAMFIPLLVDNNVKGIISIQDIDRENAYSSSDVRLLQTLANAMSVALENARLFDETQRLLKETKQRAAELQIINSVQEGLASKLDFNSIIELVGNKIREIFGADVVGIGIYDSDKNLLHFPFVLDHGERYYPEPTSAANVIAYFSSLSEPILFHTIQEGQKLMEKQGMHNIGGPTPDNSHIILSVRTGNQLMGTISIAKLPAYAFSSSDVRLLQTLASSMSVALENARLFNETQRLLKETEDRNSELQIINSVQQGLATRLDVQSIYDLVGDRIRDIFQAQVVMISTYDKQTETIEHRYAIERGERIYAPGHHPIRGFRIEVVETRQPVLVGTRVAELAAQLGQPTLPGTLTPKTWLGVPLIVEDQVTGILSLQDLEHENAFREPVVRLLQTLAASMSVALENARLWEQEHLYRKALEREFEIGREIQAGFLPDTLPQPAGWEIAASLKSSREVAGDFYDVFELPEDKIGLVIGDVCDKGLGAALFMTLFRSLLRAVSNIDFYARVESADGNSSTARLKHAISLTNNYISETHGDTGMFATIFFGILDTRTGVLTYINGGQLPPLLVNVRGVKEVLKFTGPAVGVIADMDYVIKETTIERGESFFAYTDGLTDTENPAGETFSAKDLIPLLIKDQPLSPLLTQLQNRLADYAAGAKQFDDITLLAARRL